jgi:single-strand DNA-binding protein
MPFDINTVVLGGRLTREPRVATTDGGSVLAEFSMAINRKFRTSAGDNRRETTFVDVIVWGEDKVGFVQERLTTGSDILVEGRLELDEWVGDDGIKRSRTRVVGERLNTT